MDKKTAELRIAQLSEQLDDYNRSYYLLDDPKISDYEFDMLMQELKMLEGQFPELILPSSPTQRVGGMADNTFEKVSHIVQMASLQDVFSFEQVHNFVSKYSEDAGEIQFTVEPKIDGLSVSLEYTDGIFTRGSTRGDGFVGEDVTANLKTICSIPLKLKDAPRFLEVRGEVYMPRESFFELIDAQERDGEKQLKNPGNAAAGSLRQKNSKITAQRNLDIFIFNVQQCDGIEFSSHSQSLDYLKQLGFKTVPSYKICSKYDEICAEINNIGNKRADFSFDIDGVVFRTKDVWTAKSMLEEPAL